MWKGVALLISLFVPDILGRGRMMEPVGRQSRWRIDELAPINYNDDGLDCGGVQEQWGVNNGRCGLCGDSYSLKQPRPNEFGGIFGAYAIVRKYPAGQAIPISIKMESRQKGHFTFDICNMDESEDCFAKNLITVRYFLPYAVTTEFGLQLDIPANLHCQHCVLRWTYRDVSNWGPCTNGTHAEGCGPQRMLRNCADISLL